MKRIVILLFVMINAVSLGQDQNKGKAKLLTYTVDLDIISDTMPESLKFFLNQKYGDTLEMIYDSHGNIRMDYYYSGEYGLRYAIYNAKKHTMYLKYRMSDTVYFFDTSINTYILDSTKRELISGGFALKYFSHGPELQGGAIQEYQFADKSLTVKPKLYKDFKDFFFVDILGESQLIPTEWTIKSNAFMMTRSLAYYKTIKNPKKSEFMPDKKLPLKKYL